ncbi:hypothetical protein Sme01_22310 [Sphaerisporangium melleum]|uniref:WD40 repeat domain-containing protein n=1 Tax=Sphaerisporangium melleum TaxID=321316 RepID=A0A917QZP7_9ACTN|nr:PD40 domain-containing protein [Sphaerisporangium melleum]GGK78995.1 hypothetical protein GCM10007964_22060 [Sphaerisporangium melleum]GII69755.1 hypothetical protein Sme01_22310 [Sphaerisporangium melleum]
MKHRLPLATVSAAVLLAPLAASASADAASAATAVPATAHATAPAGTSARPLTGVAVYARYDRGYAVTRYTPAKGFTRLGVAPDTAQFSASPDGEKVAWVTAGGQVQVAAGAKPTTIAKGAPAGIPCLTPVWSPDSTKIAFPSRGTADALPVVIVNARGTGKRVAGSTTGTCHLAWSANGRYLAGYAGTTEGVFRLDLTTGRSVKVKGVKLSNHVQSLSPDGRRVVVRTLSPREPGGDGAWPTWYRPTIIDTATGAQVPIPVSGRLVGALYLPDGRLVVRVAGATHNTLVVLSASGKRLQRLAEPAAARTQALLHVVR